MIGSPNRFFESKVEIPRVRVGKRQTMETLINKEALFLAGFLRNERKTWILRDCYCIVWESHIWKCLPNPVKV